MKRIVTGIVVLVVAVFALSAWRKSQARNESSEGYDRGMANLEARRKSIGTLGKNIASLEALVKQKNWTEDTVPTTPGTTAPTLTVWADELRQDTPPFYDYLFSDLTFMRTIVAWAVGEDAYPDVETATNDQLLDHKFAPVLQGPIAIIEIRKLVRPEIAKLELSKDKTKPSVAGEFRPGMLAFTVAVVDPQTAKVLAAGSGEVTNSKSVVVRGGSEFLLGDLRTLAEQKAKEIVTRLLK